MIPPLTEPGEKKKAMIAMSGGVDSSVAAYLTCLAGYDTVGVTMKLYDNGMIDGCCSTCCSLSDIDEARSVANRLGIKHYVFNFEDDFRIEVVERFIKAYEQGATPNPCIDCNRYIKFKRLFRRGKELGRDYIVTGHYARVCYDAGSGRYLLKKAADKRKDQSYVLYSMNQEELSHAMFPLGAVTKDETRRIAGEMGFVNAHKRDSQDICFVPDGDYSAFIRRQTGREYPPGDFVTTDGRVLGAHRGIINYTIGQRKGLGLALPKPLYVVRKEPGTNRVVLAANDELFSRELTISDINWIACGAPEQTLRLEVKIRYSQSAYSARVVPTSETTARIIFDKPVRAVTKGQAAVMYDADTVVGGGTIDWEYRL